MTEGRRKRKAFRPDEVAYLLSVSLRTVYRLIGEGELLAFQTRKGGDIRILAESVDRYIKERLDAFQFDNGILPKNNNRV